MVSSLKSVKLGAGDSLGRRSDDAFAADESGVRWDLVHRVRQALEEGTYQEDARVDALLDRLTIDLDL